jgi:hypothetical protein
MKAKKLTSEEFYLLSDKDQIDYVASRLEGRILFPEKKAAALRALKNIKHFPLTKPKTS